MTDRGHCYTHFNDFGHGEVFGACNKYLSTTSWSFIGRRLVGDWFSVVCDRSVMVCDCRTMVFSILAKTLRIRLVCDQSVTSRPPVANQSPTGGRQSVQIGEIAKTCRRTVGDWSPMGGNLRAMVGDSPTISVDLLPTDCGPLAVRPVLD